MVYSGNETLRLHGEALYASVQLDSKAHLVLDAPWGYTLFKLSQLPRPVLVVTGSSSEPYLRDLLDLEPEGLLADLQSRETCWARSSAWPMARSSTKARC